MAELIDFSTNIFNLICLYCIASSASVLSAFFLPSVLWNWDLNMRSDQSPPPASRSCSFTSKNRCVCRPCPYWRYWYQLLSQALEEPFWTHLMQFTSDFFSHLLTFHIVCRWKQYLMRPLQLVPHLKHMILLQQIHGKQPNKRCCCSWLCKHWWDNVTILNAC